MLQPGQSCLEWLGIDIAKVRFEGPGIHLINEMIFHGYDSSGGGNFVVNGFQPDLPKGRDVIGCFYVPQSKMKEGKPKIRQDLVNKMKQPRSWKHAIEAMKMLNITRDPTQLSRKLVSTDKRIDKLEESTTKQTDELIKLSSEVKKLTETVEHVKNEQEKSQEQHVATMDEQTCEAFLKAVSESHSARADTFTHDGDLKCLICCTAKTKYMLSCCKNLMCIDCYKNASRKCPYCKSFASLRPLKESEYCALQRKAAESIEEHVKSTLMEQLAANKRDKNASVCQAQASTSMHRPRQSTPRPITTETPPYSPLPQTPTPPYSPMHESDPPWSCGYCSFNNDGDANCCARCSALKVTQEEIAYAIQMEKKLDQEKKDLELARSLENTMPPRSTRKRKMP